MDMVEEAQYRSPGVLRLAASERRLPGQDGAAAARGGAGGGTRQRARQVAAFARRPLARDGKRRRQPPARRRPWATWRSPNPCGIPPRPQASMGSPPTPSSPAGACRPTRPTCTQRASPRQAACSRSSTCEGAGAREAACGAGGGLLGVWRPAAWFARGPHTRPSLFSLAGRLTHARARPAAHATAAAAGRARHGAARPPPSHTARLPATTLLPQVVGGPAEPSRPLLCPRLAAKGWGGRAQPGQPPALPRQRRGEGHRLGACSRGVVEHGPRHRSAAGCPPSKLPLGAVAAEARWLAAPAMTRAWDRASSRP